MNALCHPSGLIETFSQSTKVRPIHGLWQRAADFFIRKHGSRLAAAQALQAEYGMHRGVCYRMLSGEAKTTAWLEELLAREGVPLLEALFPELLAQRDAAAERIRLTLESRVDHHHAAGNADEALCLTRLMLAPDLDDIVRRTEGGWVRRAGRAVANLLREEA
jgi:hypothetical protein